MKNGIMTTVQGYPIGTGRNGTYIPRSIQSLQALGSWKNSSPAAESDNWLRAEIATAFQWMCGLRLGNTPAVEMMPVTAEMWLQLVGEGMTEELDRERVNAGFKILLRTIKWWPQPADLLKVLPRRSVSCTQPPEPSAPLSDEEHAEQARKLQDIMDMLNEKGDAHGK